MKKNKLINISSTLGTGLLAFFIGCEDDDAADAIVIESFNITRVDIESTGDGSQSQPELIRFTGETEGVIVNSAQNTLDFITITPTDLSLSGESIQITTDPDAEASSVDVSVDESIIATIITKGACTRGELYLVETSTKTKYGPYTVGFNPDAVDIAVDNQYVVVVNEFDWEDGTDAGCAENGTGFPGVSIYDISEGIANATLVKDIKIVGTGSVNGQLREPEGVKIAPDGETVYFTLQESNELGFFKISSPPDSIPESNIVPYTSTNHEPDGLWLNSAGTLLCTAGETDGQIGIHSIGSDGTVSTQRFFGLYQPLNGTGWEIGESASESNAIEPEEVAIVEEGGKTFVISTLQVAGLVVVLDITDPDNATFDSAALTELHDYVADGPGPCGQWGPSCGAPEGVAYRNGYVLVSNTYDPSVALFKASWAQ